jgi:hypothetical protein
MKKISILNFVTAVFFISFIALSSHLHAETQGNSDMKWEILMGLVNQEIQTIMATKASGPELKHRLFELYSEKTKLIKEKENLIFLKSAPQRIAEKGKDYFFKSSIDQFQAAQTFGLSIVKDYPKYEKNNEIYYALAINSRDFGTGKESEQFLLLSLKSGGPNAKIAHNAKVALAEYYYNEKKYHEAIFYYNDVLKLTTDEWYPKHLYNSAWCHLKERDFKKALSLIKESYVISTQKQNEGMKTQIINAIGIFFVQADTTNEGIDFYLKNSSPSSGYLLSLAKSSRSKNDFILTDTVLKVALENSIKEKNLEQEMKIRLEQLELYRENKKTDLFINAASEIVDINKKKKIGADNVLSISNKIKELAGFMQINLVKDKLKEKVSYDRQDYNKVIKLFDLLGSLDYENKSLYRYYQGETAFSVGDYINANKFYIRSIMIAKKTKKINAQTTKTIDSLLTSIEQSKLPKKSEDRFTIFALKNYIIFYPQSDRSQKIYQKLFSKYLQLKQYRRAANILLVYNHQYPKDQSIHKEMLTQVLDIYIKEKNTEQLTTWVNIIDKGFLNFPNEFIQNSIAVLGNLLFEKNQVLEKNKHLVEARLGYDAIYNSKFYPLKIKSEAAYAISSVFLQENNSKESLQWFKKSIEKYADIDLLKTTGNIYNLAQGHRLLQHFDNSAEIAKLTLNRFCQKTFIKKDDFYELILKNSFLENESVPELVKIEKEFSKCKITEKKIQQVQTDILLMLITGDQYKNILSYINGRELTEESSKILKSYLQFKFWKRPTTMLASFKDLSVKYPSLNLQKTISDYDNLRAFKEKITNMRFTFTSQDKFNDEKYNNELEQYLAIVTELTNDAVKLSKTSPPEVLIELQNLLPLPYKALQSSILKFRPKGVDEKYLKGFLLGMRQISESLSAKILQFEREKMMFFDKNHFFFQVNNHATLGTEKMNIDQALDFHSAIHHSQTVELDAEKK